MHICFRTTFNERFGFIKLPSSCARICTRSFVYMQISLELGLEKQFLVV